MVNISLFPTFTDRVMQISDDISQLLKTKKIILSKRQGRIKEFVRERRFLCEAWKRNRNNSRKAVVYRLLYRFAKMFKYRKLWIISDFVNRADDNGEALFQYLQTHKPRRTRVVFAIRKDSTDYHRLSKTGHCVDVTSFRFKLLFLLCDTNISSHADQWYYYSHLEETRDIHARTKYVFLQHGITENSVSEYLSRYKINISGFVTAALPEYDSIKEEAYGYRKGEVWLTGFPRFDRLFHAEKKCITIMPTWRKNLVENWSAEKGTWDLKTGFEEQEFYKFYDALINSDRLLRALQQLGYRLQFFPHPIINPYIDKFHHDPRVFFLPITETTYRDVFAKSDLMVTDYSSAILDFAYLRKPLFFCQFDYVYFYSDHYQKGYHDFEKDGFGEVVYDLDHTIDLIIEYAKGGCVLKDKYRERIDAFFAFNDQNN